MSSVRRSTRLSLKAVALSPRSGNEEAGSASSTTQAAETKRELKVVIKKEIEEILIDTDTSEDEELSRKRRRVISSSDSEYVLESASTETDADEMKHSAANKKFLEVSKKENQLQQQQKAPKTSSITKKTVNKEPNFNNYLPPKGKQDITPLEALRRKNIEERMRLFQELKINDAREELQKAVREAKSIKPRQASKVALPKNQENLLPTRRSLRIVGIQAPKVEEEEDAPRPSFRYSAPPTSFYTAREWGDAPRNFKKVLPMLEVKLPKFSETHYQNVITSSCDNMIDSKVKDTSIAEMSVKEFKNAMKHITLTYDHKIKVVPTRIYSMAFHPTFNGSLLVAGCKSGAVGVWNADLEDKNHDGGLITFSYQVKPTSCVSFSETDPYAMYSTSYDGTFRRGDLQKQTFTLLHITSEDERDNHLNWHCELSSGVFLVAQGNGSVIQVDSREPESKAVEYKCYERSMRTISLHPGTKQHILTTSSTRLASIWDIRAMKKCVSAISFKKCPSGAFFSPVTGNKILTTSYDDNISIYSSADLTNLKLQSRINHNNNTGRWVTNFKSTWHPQREDIFIVGCMDRPRKLEIFHTKDEETDPLVNLRDAELFTTVGAVALFHPTAPVVACGNASGYIHLFK